MAAAAGLVESTGAWTRALAWPVATIWRVCGVFRLDLTYNWHNGWVLAVLLASGVLNMAFSPWSVCSLDGWCDDTVSTSFRRLYTRMVALSSVAARAIIAYKARAWLDAHSRLDRAYDRSWPLSGRARRWYLAYASSMVVVYVLLTLPINASRLYLLYQYEDYGNTTLLFFFFNVYLQNWSMCCMETHFELLCFCVYLQFRAINDELSAVRTDVMVSNRYPVALRSMRPIAAWRRRRRWRRRARYSDDDEDDDDNDDYGSIRFDERSTATSVLQDPRGRPLETIVEVLRIRHGLMRETVERLKDLFGAQLAMSLIVLSIMVLFDIYNEAFHENGTNSRSGFIYGWLLQYIFRFLAIVITAHCTTQEGNKTKVLVTEINNRHLNNNTKYELQLFLKQMNYQSIEITVGDCVTLNSRLVASAVAVGTTYLFLLIQFRVETD